MVETPSSFRDPSGFVFELQTDLYRSVSKNYEKEFNFFINSGLCQTLFQQELLVRHEIVKLPGRDYENYLAILKPEKLPLISYPYEWCFSQLKDAALLTLSLMKISLNHGMILKDASAFNVQFKGYKPIFIDTLSFDLYEDGQIWKGYRQFCEHFLAPLCLSAYLDSELHTLSKLKLEGVSLKLTSRLLPWYTWAQPALLAHIHLHAKSISAHAQKNKSSIKAKGIPKRNLLALIDHLQDFVNGLTLRRSEKTQWKDYDQETHYSGRSSRDKENIVKEFIRHVRPEVVWDIGANTGHFSLLSANDDCLVLSLDSDSLAIEKNFLRIKKEKNKFVYPLLFDLVNPSSSMGWANRERIELQTRSRPNLIMALALIHHIVITHNIPFKNLTDYFASVCDWLIVEFIPEDDEKVLALEDTAGKKSYSRDNFNKAFFSKFEMIEERPLAESRRVLLLLRKIK